MTRFGEFDFSIKKQSELSWKLIYGKIENISKKLQEIKNMAPDFEKVGLRTLELIQKRLDELKLEVREIYLFNEQYYFKKDNDVYEYFEYRANLLSHSISTYSDKLRIGINEKNMKMKNKNGERSVRGTKDKFEYIFRDTNFIGNAGMSEYAQNSIVHNNLSKLLGTIEEKPLENISSINKSYYGKIFRCIKIYKEHYDEMPSPEMVSDIIDVPLDIVEQIMETIEISSRNM